jgi:hypothetical protein
MTSSLNRHLLSRATTFAGPQGLRTARHEEEPLHRAEGERPCLSLPGGFLRALIRAGYQPAHPRGAGLPRGHRQAGRPKELPDDLAADRGYDILMALQIRPVRRGLQRRRPLPAPQPRRRVVAGEPVNALLRRSTINEHYGSPNKSR